jgi:hypothetical protein
MNNRARANDDYSTQQQELYNQYFSAKKEEQNNLYNKYYSNVDSYLDEYGELNQEQIDNILTQAKNSGLDEYNSGILSQYLNSLLPTEKELKQREAAKYYDYYSNEFADEVSTMLDENGKLTEEEIIQLYSKLEDSKDKIGEQNYFNIYNSLNSYKESASERENRLYNEKLTQDKKDVVNLNPYVDENNFVDVDSATVTSFGDYFDSGSKHGTSNQDIYVKNIIEMAKNNQLIDGDIIDFNYGAGSRGSNDSIYVYYKGRFYKVDEYTRDDANIVSQTNEQNGLFTKNSTTPTRKK